MSPSNVRIVSQHCLRWLSIAMTWRLWTRAIQCRSSACNWGVCAVMVRFIGFDVDWVKDWRLTEVDSDFTRGNLQPDPWEDNLGRVKVPNLRWPTKNQPMYGCNGQNAQKLALASDPFIPGTTLRYYFGEGQCLYHFNTSSRSVLCKLFLWADLNIATKTSLGRANPLKPTFGPF